jgi:hypothetical protein
MSTSKGSLWILYLNIAGDIIFKFPMREVQKQEEIPPPTTKPFLSFPKRGFYTPRFGPPEPTELVAEKRCG